MWKLKSNWSCHWNWPCCPSSKPYPLMNYLLRIYGQKPEAAFHIYKLRNLIRNGKEWYLPSTKWVSYWLIGVRGLWNTSFPILGWISNSIVEQDEGPKSTYWWNLIGGAKNPDSEFLGWRQWPRWIQFQCLTFGRKSAKSGCSRSQFRWYTGGSCPQPQSSNSNSMIYEIRIKFCANFAT